MPAALQPVEASLEAPARAGYNFARMQGSATRRMLGGSPEILQRAQQGAETIMEAAGGAAMTATMFGLNPVGAVLKTQLALAQGFRDGIQGCQG